MTLHRFRSRNHPQQSHKPEVDDRGTDPVFFAILHERFRFTIDVAASEKNRKLERFFTIEDDGLSQSWARERVWCNPPYSSIEPWIRKAWRESQAAQLIVMLLPANRTEQSWWQKLVEPYRDRDLSLRTEFVRGRVRFIHRDAKQIGPNERPPFGVVLLIWTSPVASVPIFEETRSIFGANANG